MLVDLSVNNFLDKVASREHTPGGGSIVAFSGAIASALTEMVGTLTIGKTGYEANEEIMGHIIEIANKRRTLFIADIDRDSDAYQKVFECYKMPKDTGKEKTARSLAIQEATTQATIVPMEIARNAYELMETIADVAHLGNLNAITDACIAMMQARTAVLGALMNVRVNLRSLKDKKFIREMTEEADKLERMAFEKEKVLFEAIKQELEL